MEVKLRSRCIKITPSPFHYSKIREMAERMRIDDNGKCRSQVLSDILNKVFSGELQTKDGKNYFEEVLNG